MEPKPPPSWQLTQLEVPVPPTGHFQDNRLPERETHTHTQPKGESTTPQRAHAATEQRLCSTCNELKDVITCGPVIGIPWKSWRTLDLLGRVEQDSLRRWIVTKSTTSNWCSFCSFLIKCATRMALHTKLDLNSDDWFLGIRMRVFFFIPESARRRRDPWYSWRDCYTAALELALGRGDDSACSSHFWKGWRDQHLVLPVQACDDNGDDVSDTINWDVVRKWLETCRSEHYDCRKSYNPKDNILQLVPDFCLIDCESESIVAAKGMRNLEYITLSYRSGKIGKEGRPLGVR